MTGERGKKGERERGREGERERGSEIKNWRKEIVRKLSKFSIFLFLLSFL